MESIKMLAYSLLIVFIVVSLLFSFWLMCDRINQEKRIGEFRTEVQDCLTRLSFIEKKLEV